MDKLVKFMMMTMSIKKHLFIAFVLAAPFFVSCSDDDVVVPGGDDSPISFSARSEWKDGRSGDGTRATIAPSLKTPTSPEVPEWLFVTAQDENGTAADPAMFLVKPDPENKPDPDDPAGYTDYHGFYLLESGVWKKQKKMSYSRGVAKNLKFTAYYYSENGVPGSEPKATSQINTIADISSKDMMSSDLTSFPGTTGDTEYRDHILFELKHRTAMLRLHFAVDQKYDKIRSIVLRSVKINSVLLTITETKELPSSSEEQGMLLKTSSQLFAIAFVNPKTIKATETLTFDCTYDIYDKDEIGADHCTRKAVTATNRVKLSSLPSSTITELSAGYYYDLNITIDPDYLYVLSEHDNKQHLKIE